MKGRRPSRPALGSRHVRHRAPAERPLTDYRIISQEYAQGGIKAAFLLNGGAIVALGSQVNEIHELGIVDDLRFAMFSWIAGLVLASLVWVFAFLSTRQVDVAERKNPPNYGPPNRYMGAGLIAVILSFGAFTFGAVFLVHGVDVEPEPLDGLLARLLEALIANPR